MNNYLKTIMLWIKNVNMKLNKNVQTNSKTYHFIAGQRALLNVWSSGQI